MNSRTIHSVLLFCVVSLFFITGTRVYAQSVTNDQRENIDTEVPLQTLPADAKISSQLPILSSDVGEKPLPTSVSPTLTDKPTVSPTATVTPTEQPEKIFLSPTPTIESEKQGTQTHSISMSNAGGLDPEKLFSMSNEYRKSKGLPEFQKEERTCALAASRAPEIAGEVASGNMHIGLKNRNLDYWNTENIISMRTEESAFNWWVNDKIHHDALVGNFTYSCVACSGNSCAQEFTNFQAK